MASKTTTRKTAAVKKTPAKKKSGMTTKAAIVAVLGKAQKPMRVPEIAEQVIPMAGLAGAHPRQTCYSVLYSGIKKADCPWERVGWGAFQLAGAKQTAKRAARPKARVAA